MNKYFKFRMGKTVETLASTSVQLKLQTLKSEEEMLNLSGKSKSTK